MHHQLLLVSVPLPREVLLWEQRKSKLYECGVKWRKDHMVGVHFVDVRSRKTTRACSRHFGRCSARHIAADPLAGVCSFGRSFKLHREIYAMSAVRVKADAPPRGQ